MDVKKFVLSFYKNATKDFHISRLTAPTEALKLHSHNYFQIYYVVRGNIVHHIESGEAVLSGGDVFILPPNVPHYIELRGKDVNFFSMSFLPEFIQSENNKLISDFLQTLISSPIHKIQPKLCLPHGDILFVDHIFKRIHAEFGENKTGKEALIKECVSVLLSLFARFYFEENAESLTLELRKQTALHCIEYVQNHFDEEITLEEMAHRFAMSRTSFCNMFTSVAGSPFKEFLNAFRIQRACEMLSSGEKAALVAERCGFRDFSTFHRNFKKQMGLSPTQYRIQAQK